MEPILHAASFFSAAAVSALFSAVWEGSVVAICIALSLRMVPRLSAASRSVIWLAVFSLLVLLHFGSSFTARIGGAGAAHAIQAHAIHLDLGWGVAIIVVWAVLSLSRGAQLIVSAVRLTQLAKRATPLINGETLLPENYRKAQLCTSEEVERPSVFGFFHPRILIPPALIDKLSAQELQQVVLHELEHLRRLDDWTNLLQKAALVVFPLNPALMWVERKLCAERELACDDRVLRSNAAPKAYAVCLTRLAEFSMVQNRVSLVLGAWEQRSELVRRVHRLLRRPAETMGARQTQFVTAGLILGVMSAAIALARTPQLISIESPTHEARVAQPADLRYANFGQASVSETETSLGEAGRRESKNGVAQIQLIKAVMPERAPQSISRVHSNFANATTRGQKRGLNWNAQQARNQQLIWTEQPAENQLQAENPQQLVNGSQELVVLTEWTDGGSPARVVFTVIPKHQADREDRFAAVATPDGWLIVQI